MPRYGALAFTRRQLLKLAGAASLAMPLRRLAAQPPPLTGQGAVRPFLGQLEYRDLEAATARIIPTDTLPGANEAHVADYIQGLLSSLPAADANCDHGLRRLRRGPSFSPRAARRS